MKIKSREIASLLKASLKEWWSQDPFKEGAVIAYYAIFSLPGLLVVILSVAGYVFGREAVNDEITAQITDTFGADTAEQINGMIALASERKNSVWATILGVITIIIGATGVFAQFQKSLNIIWEVKASEKKSGILRLIKVRLFSFGLIISIAFILVVSLIISTGISSLGEWLTRDLPDSILVLIQAINILLSILLLGLVFALMFKFFPDAKIRWRHVWLGAFFTAILFEAGKFGLSLYFGKAEPGSGYGTAGSVILILLWVNYASMIVFYGAEFTHQYAERHDGAIRPDKNARKEPDRKA